MPSGSGFPRYGEVRSDSSEPIGEVLGNDLVVQVSKHMRSRALLHIEVGHGYAEGGSHVAAALRDWAPGRALCKLLLCACSHRRCYNHDLLDNFLTGAAVGIALIASDTIFSTSVAETPG